MSDNEHESKESSSSSSSSSSDSESDEDKSLVSSSSSDSDNEHLSEEDSDPDLDPDGDREFGENNPDAVVVTNDPWIRARIRNKRRAERVVKKKLRLEAKAQKKLIKQRKKGLIKDVRPRDLVLKESLKDIFDNTGGYGVWNETRGWDEKGAGSRLSLYHGVVVNRDQDSGEYDVNPLRLLSLKLQSNGLVGNFRKTFKVFLTTTGKYLRVLNLSRNEINYKKGIPKEIFQCCFLRVLNLENTGGSGYVFGGTADQNQEDADDAEEEEEEDEGRRNRRRGTVTEEEKEEPEVNKYFFPNLQVLSLSGNSFEGCVKKILCVSNQLRVLNIFNNHFDGPISSKWYAPLKDTIETLDLSYNRFVGKFFTPNVCRMLGPTLRQLKVSGNAFVGSLPPDVKHFKGPLEVLHVDSNNFNGMLPKEFYLLKSLRRLWMESNYFVGNLELFGKFKELKTLVIGDNLFGEEVPDSLMKLKQLQVLRMNDCRFVGVFPIQILFKMKSLREFDCQNCKYMNQNSLKRVMAWTKERNMTSSR